MRVKCSKVNAISKEAGRYVTNFHRKALNGCFHFGYLVLTGNVRDGWALVKMASLFVSAVIDVVNVFWS